MLIGVDVIDVMASAATVEQTGVNVELCFSTISPHQAATISLFSIVVVAAGGEGHKTHVVASVLGV